MLTSEMFYSFIMLVTNKMLKAIGILITYLSPVNVVFFWVGFAILLDTLAGRWAAKKLAKRNGKDVRLEVTSKKTREGFITKVITYNIAMVTLFVIDDHLLNPVIYYFWETFPVNFIITKFIGFVIVLIELDSVDEKYYIVKGVRILTKFSKMLKRIKYSVIDIFKFKKEVEQSIKDLKKDIDEKVC